MTPFPPIMHFYFFQVFFVESVCDDPDVIAENIMVNHTFTCFLSSCISKLVSLK